jgi:hypothetical protein
VSIAVPLKQLSLRVRLPTILTHRIATHLDAMGIMNQSVEDAIRHGRIGDLFVPGGSPATAT